MLNIFVYANCQGRAYEEIFPSIIEREVNVSRIENFRAAENMDQYKNQIDFSVPKADIIIYQPIERKNHYFSPLRKLERRVLRRSRRGATILTMPYIYCGALWPMFEEGNKVVNAEAISCLIDQGATRSDLIEQYTNGNIDFFYARRLERTLSILRQKERGCDIKIADYIENNIHLRPLFLTQNHPTTEVFLRLIQQLLVLIGEDCPGNISKIEAKIQNAPANVLDLPSYWPIDHTSLQHYRFAYRDRPDEGSAAHYQKMIIDICDEMTKS